MVYRIPGNQGLNRLVLMENSVNYPALTDGGFRPLNPKRLKIPQAKQNMERGCPSMVKGGGLKIRWRRPAWVQVPPPASPIGFLFLFWLYSIISTFNLAVITGVLSGRIVYCLGKCVFLPWIPHRYTFLLSCMRALRQLSLALLICIARSLAPS